MTAIRRIEAFFHSSPIDPPREAGSGLSTAFSHIVIRLTDDEGVVGYGECVPVPGAMGQLEVIGRELLGKDPLERVHHLGKLRRWWNGPFAVSALSIALDDLVARQLGVSIASLYGGPWRSRVRPYAATYGSLVGDTLASWIEDAEALASRSFTALKLRLGVLPVADECRALEQLRARMPATMALMGDGNGGFGPTTARQMGRCAEDVGLLWFEEPMPVEGYVGYPELAADLTIPLAGGEMSLSPQAAHELLLRRGVDIIQPDPVICGGIGDTISIGSLATMTGRLCVPHTSGGAIGVAAALQALACLPDQTILGKNQLLYLEYPGLIDPTQEAIAPELLVPSDGWIDVPTSPGLGIEIDGEAVGRMASERLVVGGPPRGPRSRGRERSRDRKVAVASRSTPQPALQARDRTLQSPNVRCQRPGEQVAESGMTLIVDGPGRLVAGLTRDVGQWQGPTDRAWLLRIGHGAGLGAHWERTVLSDFPGPIGATESSGIRSGDGRHRRGRRTHDRRGSTSMSSGWPAWGEGARHPDARQPDAGRSIEILCADGVGTPKLADLLGDAAHLAAVEGLDQAATGAALEEMAAAHGLVLTLLPSEAPPGSPHRPLRLWLQGPA